MIELRVPSVGESITEVQIGAWLKQQGEAAAADEPVVLLETDKASVELPAPAAGRVSRIVKGPGETAKVGEVIGYLEEGIVPAERVPVPPEEPSSATSVSARDAAAPAAEPEAPPPAKGPAPPSKEPASARVEQPPRVMPAARRALAQSGLSAEEITPSGPGGRVLKEDVMARARARGNGGTPPAQAPSAPKAPPPDPRKTRETGESGERVVPMTRIRRAIAERLVSAQREAALLTTFNEADMSAVQALRQELKEEFQKRHGVKLGMMSFFVKAVVDALDLVPELNAEIRGTDIVYRDHRNVGIAVGGGRGLVVPVLRAAETMSFADIERTIADFGTRAKENRLLPADLAGGTFTISNGGIYGSLLSTPIVNPPQSGVLGMHAIQDRPVARGGQVVVRPMMYLALTYDHRIVDGREAVTFLKRVKDVLESPARMLLEV